MSTLSAFSCWHLRRLTIIFVPFLVVTPVSINDRSADCMILLGEHYTMIVWEVQVGAADEVQNTLDFRLITQ